MLFKAWQGPLIVDDQDATTAALLAGGAEITKPEALTKTFVTITLLPTKSV